MTTTDAPSPQHAAAHGDVAEAPPSAPAADPAVLALPTFSVGAIALGLNLLGFEPNLGGPVVLILFATGIGMVISTLWAAAVGQSAVAGIFGTFACFWISYSLFVLSALNGWFGITEETLARSQQTFLICWLTVFVVLTLAALRLPAAFTLLFVLVDVAVAFVLAGAITGSTILTQIGGVGVLGFTAVGLYLFIGAMGVATGGSALPVGKPVIGG